ncbi:MAG: hypothetical protein ACTSVI_08870 [Promethearchaeota archaeon]
MLKLKIDHVAEFLETFTTIGKSYFVILEPGKFYLMQDISIKSSFKELYKLLR